MRLLSIKSETTRSSLAAYLLWRTIVGGLVESSTLYLPGRRIPWVVCMPSSVGCSMGCRICAMRQCASPRQLELHEFRYMLTCAREHFGIPAQYQVSFMGQGEPLLNTENVFQFCADLCKPNPLVVLGISTVGISAAIRALASQQWASRVKLQLSLHCWPSGKRERIIPAERKHPIARAISEGAYFADRSGNPCCLNVALLQGVNDSREDADNIAKCAQLGSFYVKVSDFNPHSSASFLPSSEVRAERFCRALRERGVCVHRFKSIGTSLGAGCGQTRLLLTAPSGRSLSCGKPVRTTSHCASV